MADLYVRSYNPIWDFRSLTGLPLDDTSWAYFLTNDLPYIPQAVYQTPDGIPWNSPVQLSAAGTLQNIFFQPDKVYRIEIRTNVGNLTPPSQQDALVWLIEDYVPQTTGTTPPITTATISSSNQITNPQFVDIDFVSPLTASGQTTKTITIGNGWDLVLEGTGNYTITQVPLNSASTCPTNAPYALELNLTGWGTAYLRQRFSLSGDLWAKKHVAASITALIDGAPNSVVCELWDSDGHQLQTVLSTNISSGYEEYTNSVLLPESENTNVPPAAYIEYRIIVPGSSNISITSIQLIASDNQVALPYEQITTERQIDQTFHNYRDSILHHPKSNILVGWDFPQNPWQFSSKTLTNLSGTGGYTADQTIVITEEANSVQVGASTTPLGYLEIASRIGQPQGRVAVIQYIDHKSCISLFGSALSSAVSALLTTSHATAISLRACLIWSNSLPGSPNPISGWTAAGPVFSAGWNEIQPLNNPAYLLTSTLQNFYYDKMQTLANTSATATMALVLYTTGPMSTIGSDSLLIKRASLVENDIAINLPPISYDETLRQCQYYYEKSYGDGILPGAVSESGDYSADFLEVSGVGHAAPTFSFNFKTVKRTSAPTLTFYSPSTGASATTLGVVLNSSGTSIGTQAFPITDFNQHGLSNAAVSYYTKYAVISPTPPGMITAILIFQYTIDARLGLVA